MTPEFNFDVDVNGIRHHSGQSIVDSQAGAAIQPNVHNKLRRK